MKQSRLKPLLHGCRSGFSRDKENLMINQDPVVLKMETNIAEKTGRSVPEWIEVVQKSGLRKHGEIVKLLKTDHGFTHGYANLVAHQALQSSAAHLDEGDLVTTQYAGDKAGLRAIYDKLLQAAQGFGPDLEVAPKKGYVSLRRKKQFALVQPSTKTRVDLGINLKGTPPAGRLEASGSFNAMVSHRVRLESVKDVDAEVIGWLQQAFEAAG
jgi:predicted transport protein